MDIEFDDITPEHVEKKSRVELDSWEPRMESTVSKVLASRDRSKSYDMSRAHVFELENGKVAVVIEEG